MKKVTSTENLFTNCSKSISLLSVFRVCLFFLLFLSVKSFGQTFPTSCTSKDLTLISATLPAPANNRCNCEGDRVLVLGINNGTGSFRTSFALWGTLKTTDAGGATSSATLFACANGIEPKKDNFLNATTIKINGVDAPVSTANGGYPTIHVGCGQSLDIVDLHLAWTSASPGETCSVLYASPSTINPKCGVVDKIHVGLGLEPGITTTQATCSGGGKIKVTPSGGIPNYSVCVDGGSCTTVAAGSFYEFTGLSAGAHTITVKDNISGLEADRCQIISNATIASPATVTAPVVSNVTITCSSNPTGAVIGEAASSGHTYSWSPSTGLSSTTASQVTANPSSTTTYTLTKTNSSSGCTASSSVTVTVNKTTPTADAGANVTVTCDNPSALLTATGGVSYLWSTNETTASITVSPPSTTIYNVTVTGNNGCKAVDNVTVVANNTGPTADAGSNVTVTCTNPSALLTATGGVSYLWSTTETTASITVSPSSTTIYNVTVTGSNGCKAVDNVTVTADKTAPNADAGSNVTVTCTTPGATLTATGGVSYLWSTTQTTPSINVSPSSTTIYNVTVTGSNGCKAVDNVTVTADKGAPSADAGSNVTVNCTTTSALLTATGGVSYLWSTAETTASINVSPSSTTIYNVTVTGSNGCKAVDNVTVVVNNTLPSFTVCLTQPDLCTQYGSVTIKNASGGSGFEYKLNSGGYQPGATFNNLASGSVSSITVRNSDGCTSTQSCTNFVQDCVQHSIANRQTPTYTDEVATSTTVKAYPNPFSDRIKFLVTSSIAGNGSLDIYNMMGQKVKTVYTGIINSGAQTFELSLPTHQVSSLVYVLRVGDKKLTGKIIQINQ